MPPKPSKKSLRAPADLPRTTNTHDIRRVLAEREIKDGKRGYLVDWIPTWEPMVNARDIAAKVLEEWEDTKEEKRIFQLKDGLAPSELFKDEEWVFESGDYEQRAAVIAENHKMDAPSASEVVKRTYGTIWERSGPSRYPVTTRDKDLAYRAIKVKYVGSVDPAKETVRDKRPASSVISFLIPLFAASLRKLKNPTWTFKNAHVIALSLSETVALFPTHAPYLLKHPMLLMFTRLFLMGDRIAEKLNTVSIEVGDEWHEHTRDEFLWTYCGDWEKRPIDCVERTYTTTRDEICWYVENDVDKDGNVIVAAPEDARNGEDSDGNDDGGK
ncbi:hypothetical protein BKA58DRAFT_456145 [Alternaria rosae]|uniref:uncharacterized protein n=1 Tax=Alternaria rosae TaxID=1187941 RepID=UPI001E8EDCB7|nr:uncharacterized protein BKA58DRAFT_456145 [Alternaria rosae]KAH6872557.1 hypothetical protein BKA58DRAFT_456145 [Alternaria rosae]